VKPRGQLRAAASLEVADPLLLLGVDRNDRLMLLQRSLCQSVDVAKLGIPILMVVSFSGFAVGLQAKFSIRNSSPTTVWLIW
jgi:hypothetical protein